MKRRWILSLALVCALAVAGCSQAMQADVRTNTVAACELSEREQRLVELVGAAQQDVAFLEYAVEQPYRSMAIWAELYQDGALIETPLALGLSGEGHESNSGLAALTIAPELWTLAASDDQGARYTQSAKPAVELEGYAMALSLPQEPIAFSIEEEVVMAARLYNKNEIAVGALSELADPANLEGYAYALVLKGRFSMSDAAEQEIPGVEASEDAPEVSEQESAAESQPQAESSAPESEAAPEPAQSTDAPPSQAEVLKALADSVAYSKDTGELSLTIPEGLADIADPLLLHVSGRVRMGNGYRSWHAFEQESESGKWTPGKTYTTYVEVWQIDFLEVTMSFLPQESAGEAKNDTILVQVDNKGDLRMIVPKAA